MEVEMFCPMCRSRTRWESVEGLDLILPMKFWRCKKCGHTLFSPDGRRPRSSQK